MHLINQTIYYYVKPGFDVEHIKYLEKALTEMAIGLANSCIDKHHPDGSATGYVEYQGKFFRLSLKVSIAPIKAHDMKVREITEEDYQNGIEEEKIRAIEDDNTKTYWKEIDDDI